MDTMASMVNYGSATVFLMMYRIKKEQNIEAVPLPCEYFDLIGRRSTGGLISLVLGRLRMPVKTAIEAYNNLAQDVCSKLEGKNCIFCSPTSTSIYAYKRTMVS
ncbi:hypothetical protein DFH08DRAFT_826380 [Mycena albidolilacea]|uniref:Uncharacterized protein n=1 Tax=Mycena albidolilacea TaxID=1033008 RepID=A0AAD7E8B1_9AGAR|nr:hypothetical protein DFH08DRAFT_826380 [Mycena albidolilacea]